jgi:hypothetical protein
VDFSDKIINLVEKISNFLIVSSEEPNFIYNQQDNCFVKKPFAGFDEIDFLKPKSNHNRKNLSANLDRVFIDNLMQSQKDYEINKLDMFYQEIESIYEMSQEIKESVAIAEIATKADQERRSDEQISLSTSAILNIEMIKDYSDVRVSTYKRLLTSCNSNFKDISEEILKTVSKMKSLEAGYFKNDPYSDLQTPKKDVNNTPTTSSNSGGKDKNSMINEKLEMLRHLKEKKDQILNENQNQKGKRNTRHNRTIKIKNIDGTMTEIDVINESCLNENVVVNFLPTSNINNVNKPSEQNLQYKKVFEEFDEEEAEEIEDKVNSMDESEMIINFDDCIDDEPLQETVKVPNDTVLQTCNDFMKSHKRSKSHLNGNPIVTASGHASSQSHQQEKQ